MDTSCTSLKGFRKDKWEVRTRNALVFWRLWSIIPILEIKADVYLGLSLRISSVT